MNLTNLTFTQGIPFNQSYKIKASEHIRGIISGLPDGISGRIRNNIINIRGVATTTGSGNAIITIDGINYDRPWTVIAERQTRGIPERSEPRQSGFNMADSVLIKDEDFDVTGTYTGSPTNIYVEGLLRNWTYTWGGGTIHVLGDAADVKRLETGIWKIIIDGTEYTADWRVAERVPVITNPGTKTVYLNNGIRIPIEISRDPSGVSMEGLQAKMYYERSEDGAELLGIPDRTLLSSENRKIIVNASTAGGTDTENFKIIVSNQTPPAMSTVSYNAGTFTWNAVSGAGSYAYRIEGNEQWIDVGNVTTFYIDANILINSEFVEWRVNSPFLSEYSNTAVRKSILYSSSLFSTRVIGGHTITLNNSGLLYKLLYDVELPLSGVGQTTLRRTLEFPTNTGSTVNVSSLSRVSDITSIGDNKIFALNDSGNLLVNNADVIILGSTYDVSATIIPNSNGDEVMTYEKYFLNPSNRSNTGFDRLFCCYLGNDKVAVVFRDSPEYFLDIVDIDVDSGSSVSLDRTFTLTDVSFSHGSHTYIVTGIACIDSVGSNKIFAKVSAAPIGFSGSEFILQLDISGNTISVDSILRLPAFLIFRSDSMFSINAEDIDNLLCVFSRISLGRLYLFPYGTIDSDSDDVLDDTELPTQYHSLPTSLSRSTLKK